MRTRCVRRARGPSGWLRVQRPSHARLLCMTASLGVKWTTSRSSMRCCWTDAQPLCTNTTDITSNPTPKSTHRHTHTHTCASTCPRPARRCVLPQVEFWRKGPSHQQEAAAAAGEGWLSSSRDGARRQVDAHAGAVGGGGGMMTDDMARWVGAPRRGAAWLGLVWLGLVSHPPAGHTAVLLCKAPCCVLMPATVTARLLVAALPCCPTCCQRHQHYHQCHRDSHHPSSGRWSDASGRNGRPQLLQRQRKKPRDVKLVSAASKS